MSQRDRYEHGVPCWVDTLQTDPDAAVAFYAGVFGWEFGAPGDMPGDPPGRYFVAQLRGRDVAGVGSLPADAQPLPPSWSMYVCVDSADDAAAAALDAGGAVLVEPFDAPPAGRMAVLADPTGAPVCAWQPGVRQGAQLVNEASAWAMSQLRARPRVRGRSTARSSAGRPRRPARGRARSPCSAYPASSAASPSSPCRAR